MLTDELRDKAADILDGCRKKGLKLATAESCTGGLIAALLTEIPGSSDVLERGFVVYSNRAKVQLLAVEEQLIEREGAVSEAVARQLAENAIQKSHVQLGIGV